MLTQHTRYHSTTDHNESIGQWVTGQGVCRHGSRGLGVKAHVCASHSLIIYTTQALPFNNSSQWITGQWVTSQGVTGQGVNGSRVTGQWIKGSRVNGARVRRSSGHKPAFVSHWLMSVHNTRCRCITHLVHTWACKPVSGIPGPALAVEWSSIVRTLSLLVARMSSALVNVCQYNHAIFTACYDH